MSALSKYNSDSDGAAIASSTSSVTDDLLNSQKYSCQDSMGNRVAITWIEAKHDRQLAKQGWFNWQNTELSKCDTDISIAEARALRYNDDDCAYSADPSQGCQYLCCEGPFAECFQGADNQRFSGTHFTEHFSGCNRNLDSGCLFDDDFYQYASYAESSDPTAYHLYCTRGKWGGVRPTPWPTVPPTSSSAATPSSHVTPSYSVTSSVSPSVSSTSSATATYSAPPSATPSASSTSSATASVSSSATVTASPSASASVSENVVSAASDASFSDGEVTAIALGGLLLFVLIVSASFYMVQQRRRNQLMPGKSEEGASGLGSDDKQDEFTTVGAAAPQTPAKSEVSSQGAPSPLRSVAAGNRTGNRRVVHPDVGAKELVAATA